MFKRIYPSIKCICLILITTLMFGICGCAPSADTASFDKNLDYEFYSIDDNEDHIVGFMPDENVFVFESRLDDGTFAKITPYNYSVSGDRIIFNTTEENSSSKEYEISYDEEKQTIYLHEDKMGSDHSLIRVDAFDDDGIETGTFTGLNGAEYSYKRVLISERADAPGHITYRIIYTNDLNITGEQIFQDMISATFIPAGDRQYQAQYTWSNSPYVLDE